jgi:hypothetical protein
MLIEKEPFHEKLLDAKDRTPASARWLTSLFPDSIATAVPLM